MLRKSSYVLVLAGFLGCGGVAFSGADGGEEGGGGSSSGGGGGVGSSSSSSGGGNSSSGSSSGTGSSGSSGATGSSGGSGSGGGSSPCPASPPTGGSPCAREGLTCEYGASPVSYCDEQASCSQGRWLINRVSPGDPACSAGPPITCPPSFASVPRNTHCSPYGGHCDYPEGRCACTVGPGPLAFDASAAAVWICQDPAGGCPMPRPSLGSSCSQEGLFCSYAACSIGNGEMCKGGVWIDAPVPCPASAVSP